VKAIKNIEILIYNASIKLFMSDMVVKHRWERKAVSDSFGNDEMQGFGSVQQFLQEI